MSLPDLLAPGLRVVICGTAAGEISAAVGCYYAGRGNTFWRVLHQIGLTPRQLAPAEYRQLLQYGIGLTDVVKVQAGLDSTIDFTGADTNSLTAKIINYQPRVLAFNGKKAAKVALNRRNVGFGLQPERIGRSTVMVLPSTSGLAARWWDQGIWEALAGEVR